MAGQTSWNRPGPRGVPGPPGPVGPQGPAGTAKDKWLIRGLLLLLAILAAILLLHTPAHAQEANFFEGPFVYIGATAGIPTSCATGDLAFAIDATAGQQIYEGNNSGGVCTFTQQLNSGGVGGSPGGSNTQIQYNNTGSFGGVSKWTTNGTTDFTGIATSVFDHSAGATHKLPASAAFAPTTANFWGYDTTNNRGVLGNGTDTSFLTWIHGAAPTTDDCVKFSGTLGGLITNGGPCPATKASVSHQFFTSYTSTTGVFTAGQPDYSDLTGVPSTFAPTPHNILSASHGDTTAAAAVRGDGFFAIGATPTWQRLAHPATSGGYFKWNGTDIVASTGAAGGTGTCSTGVETVDNTDAAPTCSDTPTLGTDNSVAGTITLANGGAAAHTIFASGATTTNTIKGFTVVPTTGDLLICTSATTICTLTDAAILATNIVRKDAANTGAAAMTLDMSGSTTANALKVPLVAGGTSGADGVVVYDSTAKITHVRTNAADSLVVATTGTSTTTTQVLHATATAGVYAASAVVDADIPAAITRTIANGTSAMGTGAISSATCATVVTTSATGTATTDNIMADFNADPHAVTGYVPSASGMLTIIKYPTANNVNFLVCNNTAGSITPGAITLNWRVVR